MKKILLSVTAIFAFTTVSIAQNGTFSSGDSLLNVGIGVNSYYDSGTPFGVSFEKGVSDDFSVGGDFNYLSSKYALGYGYELKFTAMYIGARGSYHLNDTFGITDNNFDVYVGASLGYRSFTWSDNIGGDTLGSSYGSGIYFGGFGGAKYYFTEKIGAFLEIGATGSSNARIGIAFKL